MLGTTTGDAGVACKHARSHALAEGRQHAGLRPGPILVPTPRALHLRAPPARTACPPALQSVKYEIGKGSTIGASNVGGSDDTHSVEGIVQVGWCSWWAGGRVGGCRWAQVAHCSGKHQVEATAGAAPHARCDAVLRMHA